MARLLFYGAHFLQIRHFFLLFCQIPSDQVLVYTNQKTLVKYESVKLPIIPPNDRDYLNDFYAQVQVGDIVYMGDTVRTDGMSAFQKTLSTCKIIAYYNDDNCSFYHRSYNCKIDLFDHVFDFQVQLLTIESELIDKPNLHQQYSTFTKQGSSNFFKWYLSKFDDVSVLMKSLTKFDPYHLVEFYNNHPKIHLISFNSSDFDQGPPYLAKTPYTDFSGGWFKGRRIDTVWAHLYCDLYNNTNNSKKLSISLGANKIFPLIPFLYELKFKLSRRICTQIALEGITHHTGKTSETSSNLFQLCLNYVKSVKNLSFKRFTTDDLVIFFKYLDVPKYRQKQLLMHRGLKANIKHTFFEPGTGKPIQPFLLEPTPHTETINWLTHPKSKKFPDGINYLLKTNNLPDSIAVKWKQTMREISKEGLIYTIQCKCGCKSFQPLNDCIKMCNSETCDAFITKSCIRFSHLHNNLKLQHLITLIPGKIIPFDLESKMLCSFCHKGRIFPQFFIPQLPTFAPEEENTHGIYWCKMCHEALLVSNDKIEMTETNGKLYFVCDKEQCQINKKSFCCPSCHHAVEKTQGCNDMLCRCNNRFCFCCLRTQVHCSMDKGYPCLTFCAHHSFVSKK